MWILNDGTIIRYPMPVRIGDTLHPSNIFKNWTKSELSSIGILPFREVLYNEIFYDTEGTHDNIINGELVRTYDLKERYSIEEAKNVKITEIKSMASNLLRNTDWYIIRMYERGVEIPAYIVKERSDILSWCDQMEEVVNSFTSYKMVSDYSVCFNK